MQANKQYKQMYVIEYRNKTNSFWSSFAQLELLSLAVYSFL